MKTVQEKLDNLFEIAKPLKDSIEKMVCDFEKQNPKIKVIAGLNKEANVFISFIVNEDDLD